MKSERLLIELLEFVQEVMVVYSSEILMQNRCPFILTIKALFRQTKKKDPGLTVAATQHHCCFGQSNTYTSTFLVDL